MTETSLMKDQDNDESNDQLGRGDRGRTERPRERGSPRRLRTEERFFSSVLSLPSSVLIILPWESICRGPALFDLP